MVHDIFNNNIFFLLSIGKRDDNSLIKELRQLGSQCNVVKEEHVPFLFLYFE